MLCKVTLGGDWFRPGADDNVCKAVWVGTVKRPKKTNVNGNIEFQDFALAA